MADIIGELAELSWRPDSFGEAVRAPCASAPFEFAHALPERGYPYVDGKGHDWTGREPLTGTARLVFLNSVEPASFPENYNRWQDALFTGEAGDLVHPIAGVVRARIQRGSVSLEAGVRNGTFVEFAWTETVDDPAVGILYLGIDINLSSTASAAEVAANAFGVTYKPGITAGAFTSTSTPTKPTFASAESHSTLVGAVAELQSYGLSSSGATQAASLAEQLAGRVSQMVRDVEALDDPMAWPAYDNLVATWTQLKDMAQRLEKKTRATARVRLDNPTTLDAFARARDNEIGEIINLNPHALAAPLVEKGVYLRYYTGRS